MPTYDYECSFCYHEFEIFHQPNEYPVIDCPSCGETEVRRLQGPSKGVIFKGSGFYRTDYYKTKIKKENNMFDIEKTKSKDKKYKRNRKIKRGNYESGNYCSA